MSIVLVLLCIPAVTGLLLMCVPLLLVRFWLLFWKKPRQNTNGRVTVGFFHPYCNAGGGGERVLWCAIKAIQKKYPRVQCHVYTGDTDVTGEQILQRARDRFSIVLPKHVDFVFLRRRSWLEAERYPHFTLLGQSVASLFIGWEALSSFVPDVYIDTMGYAFTLPLFKYLADCKIGCYVHYPTISADMLERVSNRVDTYNNAGFISRSPTLSAGKLFYYKSFAFLYGIVGCCSDLVMVNSTWTQGHILSLWNCPDRTYVVYPPCDVKQFLQIPVTSNKVKKSHIIVSVAQFRPEKDHELQIKSFAKFLEQHAADRNKYRLVLIGGCRNAGDESRVDCLRTLSEDMRVTDLVEFKLNVSFEELKECLADATIGIHTMCQEHFGIGVVELMAAGTLTLAHKSGGPRLDIVIDRGDHKTGFLANSVATYSEAINNILQLKDSEQMEIRLNARHSVDKFSEEKFNDTFLDVVGSYLFMDESNG